MPLGIKARRDPGTVDASASVGGQYLYVQTGGNGTVDEFLVNANGSLSQIGSLTVAGAAGGEGIVAFKRRCAGASGDAQRRRRSLRAPGRFDFVHPTAAGWRRAP